MNTFRFASFSDSLPPMLGASLAVRTLIEYLIIAGAVLLVTVAVMVWVLVFRKPRKRKRVHRSHHHPAAESAASGKPPESKTASSRRKRSQSEFPRHPTLAETGGLPPVRRPQSGPTDSLPH